MVSVLPQEAETYRDVLRSCGKELQRIEREFDRFVYRSCVVRAVLPLCVLTGVFVCFIHTYCGCVCCSCVVVGCECLCACNGLAHCVVLAVSFDGFVGTMQSKGGKYCSLSGKGVIRSMNIEGTARH